VNKIATPDALKKRLEREGKSLAAFARERGVDYQIAVQLVNGFAKGRSGKAHTAAVALGLKEAA
jgi:gp16 family phage-associated protein